MDKLVVENREFDIEKQLTEYRELVRRRKMLDERIRRTEMEKDSVKPQIYDKVVREYREAFDALNQQLEPVERTVSKARDDVTTEIEATKSRMNGLQDQLDELIFRHRVGEFDQDGLEEKEGPLGEQIDKLKQKINDLETIMKRLSLDDEPPIGSAELEPFDQAYGTPDIHEEAGPGPGRAVAIDVDAMADAASEPEVEMDPTVDEMAEPPAEMDSTVDEMAEPAIGTDPAADRKGADVRDAGNQGPDAQDFVDPSDWVGEFFENAATSSPAGTHTDSQNPTNEQTTKPDPLESLADPSDDPKVDDRRGQRPTPQHFGADEPQGFPVLIITKGAGAGKRLPLLPMTMTLGREHDNNIELKDTDVSRYHARISFERGEYVIENLEGSSGTWVNGKQIDRSPLVPGDLIKAGGTEMKIELE